MVKKFFSPSRKPPFNRGPLVFVLLALVGVALWSGCRSSEPEQGEPSVPSLSRVVATATAEVVIVERGAPRLTLVQPIPSNLILSPGETIALSAISFDQSGTEIPQASYTWRGVDPSAGTITPSGVFRAGFIKGTFDSALLVAARAPVSLGQGVIQATVSVTIQDFAVRLQPSDIRVFPEVAEVEPDETVQLLAMAVDANGVVIPNRKFNWEVVRSAAGSISQDGRFTAGSAIGEFPQTIKVTMVADEGRSQPVLTTGLDVHVLDPAGVSRQIQAMTLPQVISLKPGEMIKFTSMALDSRGGQVTPRSSRWEIIDPRAGQVSPSGQFTAAGDPGIYEDAVRVSLEVADLETPVIANATVIVVESVAPLPQTPSRELPRVVIFPDRVVLSPGESARVSIIGLQGQVVEVASTDVSWSLNPPEVGEVSSFVNVTANDFPGVYEGAIKATVTLETDSGPVTQEVSATLVIRGELDNVLITPDVATVAPGGSAVYRALSYDGNGVLLQAVQYKWSVSDPSIGTIDSDGVFTAKGPPGRYPEAVRVQALQSRPTTRP